MQNPQARLAHMPVSFFAVVMGLAGLTIAWEVAERLLPMGEWVSCVLLPVSGTVFLVLSLLYGLKLIRFRDAVAADLHHPVKLSFFPAFSIGLLLLSVATLGPAPVLSKWLWLTGAALHLAFTLHVLGAWINHTHFEIHHMNPSWFIPVVGNVVVPVAGVTHGFVETSWFFFSVGMLFWLVLLVIVLYRIIFHPPLPEKLVPTLFILVAPPAVGFIAYTKLAADLDAFARVLYYSGLFLTLLLFTQFRRFARLKFFLSWWAYSFPLAAITIATFLMHELSGVRALMGLAVILLGILTLVIAALITLTVASIRRGEICVAEH